MAQTGVAAKVASDAVDAIAKNVDPAQVAQNILARVRDGKKIQEFGASDWMDVLGLSGDEIAWDGVEEKLRVAFSHEENAEEIAGSLTSSAREVKALYARFRAGEMNEADFLYESEWACLDAVVAVLASYLRLKPIDIKAFGIVVTEETLSLRYSAIKDDIRGEWEEMLARHAEEQRAQDELLEKRYRSYIEWLEKDLSAYMEILPRAFSDDPETAFAGSVELASFMKLPQAEVLSTIDDIDSFFLD